MLKKNFYNKIIILVLFASVFLCFKYYIVDRSDSVDIIIKNATILTLNKNSEIIYNGWIVVKGDEIIKIGNGLNNYRAKKTINARGKVVMPGLVNTHTHVAMAPFRGIDNESRFSDWISNINRNEKNITKDDVYWSSLFGEIEMIESGTTTFNDMYFFEESVAESIKKIGIRAVIDVPYNFENDQVYLDKSFLSKYNEIPTINFSIAPNPLINFSEQKLRGISEIAEKNNLIVHVHIEEDWKEKTFFLEKYNKTPIEMLSISGILDNKVIFAHSVNFTNKEISYLAKYNGVSISFNPKSNFKLLGYTAPIKEMIKNGLTIGIGTDGVGSGDSLDLFDHINFIAFISKECQDKKEFCDDKSGIDPEKIIRMATIDGAKSLGLENEIGSIEEGKKADLIFVDFSGISLVPSYNLYSSLVYNTDGSDVTDSIINGKVIMENKKIANVDETYIMKKVENIFKKIKTLQ